MPQWFASILERMMDFSNILNASIAASWMVLAVIALRFLLKNAPKWSHVALWGLVALRLLLPFSIESALSLIPSAETVPQEILRYEGTLLHNPAYLDVVSNPNFPGSVSIPAGQSVGSVQWQMLDMTFIWLIGIAALLLYTAISYLSLRRKLATAVSLRENIFQSENAGSPFVLGIVKPRIYLPYHMDQETLHHVIAHEQAHIRRRDHWWKPLGFLLLTIHWFNPVMWLAYVLLCRDIELACDESVIRELGHEQRADYTEALVSCSVNRRRIAACPLAFGEVGVKERVKSVMNYRKPAFWVIVLSILACVVVAACFLTDPAAEREFPINGSNVSELDAALVAEKIAKAENVADGSQLYVNGDNFDLMFTPDFNWANDGAIRFFYMKNQKTYEAQLRMFHDDNKYFITDSSEWVEQKQIFLLIHYLEALKYMPQEAIRALSPDADGYSVIQVHDGTPSDYERVLKYNQAGVGDIDGWNIHLTVHPLHKVDGSGYNGRGDEVIHLFYDSQQTSSSDVRNPWVQEYIPGAEGIIGNVDKEKFESISEDFAIGADQYGRAVFKDPYKAFDTFLVLYADGIALIQEQNDLKPISPKNYSAYKKLGWQVTSGLVEAQKQAAFVTKFLDLYENSFAEEVPSPSTEIPTTAPSSIIDIIDPTKKKGFSYDAAMEKFFEDEMYDYFFGGIYSQHVIVHYADGTTEDIVTALNSGKASIADLDRFGIPYWAEPKVDPLDAAIRSAIIEVNRHPKDPDGLYHCASFVLLQQVELSFDSDPPKPNEVTVYGIALHQSFSFSGGALLDAGGSHIPVAITFEVENGKYNLKEYWRPGDGSYYVSDIRDKFPDEIEEKALDTQKYIRAQIQNCYAQAIEFGDVDTTTAIEQLFEIIESSPLHSSNPGDYVNEHSIEYRELTYYGQYTLRYCFEQFLKGEQIGLRGHLMRALLDDLAPEAQLKLQTMTGQEYFDAWKAAAIRVGEQHNIEWIKGNQPAVWILLQMIGE